MSKIRISIADDEPDMRDYLARILPRLGYEVVSAAENGQQLVADFQRLAPDLVITDVRMPKLDGLSAIQEIRRDGPVPVIVISAQQDLESLQQQQTGPLLILTKPISGKSLQEAIAGLITNHGSGPGTPAARPPRAP